MKVVDRKTFLAMPAGTLYAKFGDTEGSEGHFYFGEVRIKSDPRGDNDWWSVGFTDGFRNAGDTGAWADEIQCMVEGRDSFPLDFECVNSDGLYDENQLFAVYSRDEHVSLVARLQQALGELDAVTTPSPRP